MRKTDFLLECGFFAQAQRIRATYIGVDRFAIRKKLRFYLTGGDMRYFMSLVGVSMAWADCSAKIRSEGKQFRDHLGTKFSTDLSIHFLYSPQKHLKNCRNPLKHQ